MDQPLKPVTSFDDDGALLGLGALGIAFGLLSDTSRLQPGVTKRLLIAIRDLRASSPDYLCDTAVAQQAVAQLSSH